MGFFDRLTNLSKGWVRQQTTGRKRDAAADALLEAELARDRAAARPAARPEVTAPPESAPEPAEERDPPEVVGPDGEVKRTL